MKFRQLTMILISFVLAALLCVNAFAENETQDKEWNMDTSVVSLINGQLSNAEISALKASGIPELVADGQFRSEYPVLKIYHELFTPKVGEPLETRLAEAEADYTQANYTDYVQLNTKPYLIRMMNQNSNISVFIDRERYSSTIPTYIADIMELSETFMTEDTCVLEGIYCFDAETSHQGIAVYLKTNKGVYVRYYENSLSEAKLFTEADFRTWAGSYYQYLISDENNYNENGEAVGGGGMSFLSFMQNATGIGDDRVEDNPVNPDTRKKIYYIIGAIAIVLLLTGSIVILAKKKRKKRSG